MNQPDATQKRYLVLGEGLSQDPIWGKTARGVLDYATVPVVALLDSTRSDADHNGVPVVASVEEALRFRPTVAVVGVATAGGEFPPQWRQLLKDCIANGLDIENGLHHHLSDDPELTELAARHGVTLTDLRRPPAGLTVATGANLELAAKTILTVGSDCANGKMTVSLELDRAARNRGIASVFVPTGQTGIAIAGWGISVDAVVADFIAGAAETLVVEGAKRGDLLMVEGQGSLTHPAYSGVTLGLMHGSAPHAYVLCHRAGSTEHESVPGHPLATLAELVDLHERMSLRNRRARVAAIALNTSQLSDSDARSTLKEIGRELGLPADDPVRFGADNLLDAALDAVGWADRVPANAT